MAVAAIVLAAGASTRLGSPKQLLDYGGRPLLEHVVSAVSEWPIRDLVVVLGAFADEILDAVDLGEAVVAINEDWDRGLSSSLRVGLDILTRVQGSEATFVALGDQPEIPGDVPGQLLAAAESSPRPAVVPVYRYERGNPALFRRLLWERLMALEGDAGAGGLLRAHPGWVEEVRVDHPMPRDVDTQDDAADLRHGTRRPGPARDQDR